MKKGGENRTRIHISNQRTTTYTKKYRNAAQLYNRPNNKKRRSPTLARLLYVHRTSSSGCCSGPWTNTPPDTPHPVRETPIAVYRIVGLAAGVSGRGFVGRETERDHVALSTEEGREAVGPFQQDWLWQKAFALSCVALLPRQMRRTSFAACSKFVGFD